MKGNEIRINGKQSICYKDGEWMICTAKENRQKNLVKEVVCDATQGKYAEIARLIGKISAATISLKYPVVAPISPIAEQIIDIGANAILKYNKDYC